jgi:hypothetical protein
MVRRVAWSPSGSGCYQPRTRRRNTHIRRFRHISVVDPRSAVDGGAGVPPNNRQAWINRHNRNPLPGPVCPAPNVRVSPGVCLPPTSATGADVTADAACSGAPVIVHRYLAHRGSRPRQSRCRPGRRDCGFCRIASCAGASGEPGAPNRACARMARSRGINRPSVASFAVASPLDHAGCMRNDSPSTLCYSGRTITAARYFRMFGIRDRSLLVRLYSANRGRSQIDRGFDGQTVDRVGRAPLGVPAEAPDDEAGADGGP